MWRAHAGPTLALLLAVAFAFGCSAQSGDAGWTRLHEPGRCAMRGVCGSREDGDPLNCAYNGPGERLEAPALVQLRSLCPSLWAEVGGDEAAYCCSARQVDTMGSSMSKALVFLTGCPACLHNFKHFFCSLVCHPDQSLFTNVTAIEAPPIPGAPDASLVAEALVAAGAGDRRRLAESASTAAAESASTGAAESAGGAGDAANAAAGGENAGLVVTEISHFVSDAMGRAFFDSCKDVVFPLTNTKAMTYIGGGAQNYHAFFEFLGLIKDARPIPVGSPFQINFPDTSAPGSVPEGMVALNEAMPSCADAKFKCSCGDCLSDPACQEAPPPPPPPTVTGCPALGTKKLRCSDLAAIATWTVVSAALIGYAMLGYHKLHHDTGLEPLFSKEKEPLNGAPSSEDFHAGMGMGFGETMYSRFTDTTEGYRQTSLPPLQCILQSMFRRMGAMVAIYADRVILVAIALTAVGTMGLLRFRIETDPARLWVGPTSQAARDAARYEESFGPFYRITQVIMSTTPTTMSHRTLNPDGTPGLPFIATNQHIELMFDIDEKIRGLRVTVGYGDKAYNVTYDDVCYKPFGGACATQSVLQYWKMNRDYYEKGVPVKGSPMPQRLSYEYCLSHWSSQCLSELNGPTDPKLVLGGYARETPGLAGWSNATAFLATYPVSSAMNLRHAAVVWEAAFLRLAQEMLQPAASGHNVTLSYSAERSVKDEIGRESTTDAATVAASYAVMLVYIATAMYERRSITLPAGRTHNAVAAGGVAVVGASVASAMGLCAAAGLWSTLIVVEVIPFLVLAVGVDNMFIIAHALQKQPASLPHAARVGEALASAGPSITYAASAEAVAFLVGALTTMPAVRIFCICAAVAIVINYLLQVTAFVAMLSLDAQRTNRAGRMRLFVPRPDASGVAEYEFADGDLSFEGADSEDADSGLGGERCPSAMQAIVSNYITKLHAPLLMRPIVQVCVLVGFGALLVAAIASSSHLSVGLAQQVALPRDSYLQHYYADVLDKARVGAPVMFVVENLNISRSAPDVDAVCGTAGCSKDSMLAEVTRASRTPGSYIADPAASWLDDFLGWVSPELDQCCRQFTNGTWCPPPGQGACGLPGSPGDPCALCTSCFGPAHPLEGGRPSAADFQLMLPWFLQSKPSEQCPKGGAGPYSDAIAQNASEAHEIVGLADRGVVATSHFRTFYAPLGRQADFIGALRATRELVAGISRELDRISSESGLRAGGRLRVYAYSMFHVFFEQYLDITTTAVLLLGGASAAVFATTWVFTGQLWASAVIGGMLALVLVDMLGAMAVAGVQLNAVALVNLATSLGIAVEFMAHITHAFLMAPPGPRPVRAAAALRGAGSSVVIGITLTKFVGVCVLALARTQIFEVYYFRMYLALVLLGAAHGLVLLPVVLSICGPPSLLAPPPASHPPHDWMTSEPMSVDASHVGGLSRPLMQYDGDTPGHASGSIPLPNGEQDSGPPPDQNATPLNSLPRRSEEAAPRDAPKP